MPAEISASVPRRQLRVYYRDSERGKSANIQNVCTGKIFLFWAGALSKKFTVRKSYSCESIFVMKKTCNLEDNPKILMRE